MIFVYHNVNKKSEDENTVNVPIFFLQMLKIKLKGLKPVFLTEYDAKNKKHIVLRFDDCYKTSIKYAVPILKFFNFKAEFFVVDDFAKSNNPYWANIEDLEGLIKEGFRLEYHSKTHSKLWEIEDENILEEEIKCPDYLKSLDENSFKYFALPYWKFNDSVLSVCKKYYKAVLSGNGFANEDSFVLDGKKIKNNIEA